MIVIRWLFARRQNIGLLLCLVVAFALRVYMLGAQSLWNDEGTSVALAPLSLPSIASAAARDIHPPLYYFLLHFWMPLAGQTEFAVRFLSVIAGVLIIALTFRIARLLFGFRTAVLAALLSAFSPFQIYYSQETRMYIWVALFAAASVFSMMHILGAEERGIRNRLDVRLWLLYVAVTIAMLYTQYVGAFVLLAENLVWLIWLVLQWRSLGQPGKANVRRRLVFWIVAQIAVGLTFGPWYLLAGSQLASWPAISEPLDLPTLVWRLLNVFSTGLTLESFPATGISLVFGILILFGLWTSRNRGANFNLLAMLAWLLVPIGVMYVVSLSRPAYNPKFLLIATPPFFMLVARGAAQLTTGRPKTQDQRQKPIFGPPSSALGTFALVCLVLLFSSIPSLQNYYWNPHYARDDYRSILRYIDMNAREDDGILIDAPGQVDVVRYYHHGGQPLFLLPRMRPPEPAATRDDIDAMLGKVKRLYAIYWATAQSDPLGIIDLGLAQQAFKAQDDWHGDVRLAVYGVAPASRTLPNQVNMKVGDQIILVNFRLDQRTVHSGDILTLTLGWQAVVPPSERYKVFVHLLDAANQIVAQRDGEPVADLRITTTWRAGENITDNYGVLLEPEIPPGEYRLEIGMYRGDNGVRLPITSPNGQPVGDHLVLGPVQVLK